MAISPRYLYLFSLSLLLLVGCSRNGADHVVGTLEWDRIELVAEASEPIAQIAVKEGDLVQAGQLLVQLNTQRVQAQVDQAHAGRAQAAAVLAEFRHGTRPERLNEARARLAGAEKVLEARERELQRVETLYEKKLLSANNRDEAASARDGARAERDAAHAVLEALLHGSTKDQLNQAEQALARAEGQVRELEVVLDRLSIRAPVQGRVDALPYKIGERAPTGNVIAVMLAGEHPYAKVFIPEALRIMINPGVKARVLLDGADKEYAGVVRSVSNEPSFTPYFALTEHDRGRLSYLAKVDLVGETKDLPAGLPLSVIFLSGAGDNLVP